MALLQPCCGLFHRQSFTLNCAIFHIARRAHAMWQDLAKLGLWAEGQAWAETWTWATKLGTTCPTSLLTDRAGKTWFPEAKSVQLMQWGAGADFKSYGISPTVLTFKCISGPWALVTKVSLVSIRGGSGLFTVTQSILRKIINFLSCLMCIDFCNYNEIGGKGRGKEMHLIYV